MCATKTGRRGGGLPIGPVFGCLERLLPVSFTARWPAVATDVAARAEKARAVSLGLFCEVLVERAVQDVQDVRV